MICPVHVGSPQLDKKKLGKFITRRFEHIKNNSKNLPLTDLNKSIPKEESIHDLDIQNCNRIFLEKYRRVAQDCKDLGILFRESEGEIVSLVA